MPATNAAERAGAGNIGSGSKADFEHALGRFQIQQ